MLDVPDINPGAEIFWRIWLRTDADRPVGFGVGYIPSEAIINWADRIEGISDRRELDLIVRMVRAIDAEYVKIKATKQQQPPSPPASE